MAKKSEIPFGAQFSPNQVDLAQLLQIIHDGAGDRQRITEAVCAAFFAGHSPDQRWKLADNTVLALRAYGLLGEDGATPTNLANEMLAIVVTPDALYQQFARHILLNLRGVALTETLAAMQSAGEEINLHRSPSKNVKGKALELLAVYFTRLLDLEFKGWRIRSADTGGAEVDVIVEGARLLFTRWQVQAKNTASVRLDDVAKEVGLSLTFTYANVVLVVTTGDFTQDAYNYSRHVMRTSSLNVILLNGAELEQISADPTSIVSLLNSKAERAMKVKERRSYTEQPEGD
ncbi:MAG: restriction endonuclease [Chloroflexi bacterium]|nr:restriction endonuclease [Chloroflexota bacterium]